MQNQRRMRPGARVWVAIATMVLLALTTTSQPFATVHAVDSPRVLSLSPSFGPVSGGNLVTIHGENFVNPGTSVKFGSVGVVNVFILGSTTLQVTAPPGTGVVDVIVTTPLGGPSQNTLADDYTYGSQSSAGVFEFAQATFSASEGSNTAYITVLRSGGTAGFATVNYATTLGSATPGSDYLATDGTLQFNSGQTSLSFPVTILNDTLVEAPESIGLVLTNPTAGTSLGAQNTSVLTIVDDETTVTAGGVIAFGLGPFSIVEGATGGVTVTRTGSTAGAVTVNYAMTVGSATTADFVQQSSLLSWPAGDASVRTISIQTYPDAFPEGTEWFTVALFAPGGGATLGTVTTTTVSIIDDDIPGDGVVEFALPEYQASEGAVSVAISVRRLPGVNNSAIAVNYSTSNSTAVAGSDYTSASGTLTFLPGETSKTFTVPLIDDAIIEAPETFMVNLSVPTGGVVLGSQSFASVIIADNDSGVPQVTGVSPSAGPLAGGNTVVINGLNLAGATLVSFGGQSAAVVTATANQVTVVAPARAIPGPVSVQVTSPLGTSAVSAGGTYTYTAGLPTVTSISPTSGPASGGTVVVINGEYLGGTIAVTFGGQVVLKPSSNDTTRVVVVAPPGVAGTTVDVQVTTNLGTSPANASARFTYTQSASIETYSLSVRWSLVTWGGTDNMSVGEALEGRETPDNPSTGSIVNRVTAVFTFETVALGWRAYFPNGAGVPGANNLTTLRRGQAYWIAVNGSTSVQWTIVTP